MIRFFLRECFICILLILMFPLVAEGTNQCGCAETAPLSISKLQTITDADQIENSKQAYDEEIKDFCLDNNCSQGDIKNVLNE